MPEEFKVGDIVRLKSGGLAISVRKITNESVECDWFDTKHEPHYKRFHKDQLIKSDSSSFQIS